MTTVYTVEVLLTDTHMKTALLTDAFAKSWAFFSTPIQTLYFYIPVSGQVQLRAPFLHPDHVCSWELPLYKYKQEKLNLRTLLNISMFWTSLTSGKC